MIVAIHQPQYLPWSGYFYKMDRADVFCYLDNVQYKKNEWQNRNRIKTARGWQWVTVPVHYRFGQKINEVTIDNTAPWANRHLQALISNYGKTPFFSMMMDIFREIYFKEWNLLSDLNMATAEAIKRALGVTTKTVIASALNTSEEPTQRLIDICRKLCGDTYLSGPDGANYMDLERFRTSGIKVVFSPFHPPHYPQHFSDFVPSLSAVDLLFNCGPQSLAIIRGDQR